MTFDFKRMWKRETNVGLKDRKLRFAVGSVALFASIFLANIPLLLIGGILVATAFLRWCPVYSGLGKSTVDPEEPVTENSGPPFEL
jgi:hypothetical protein